MKRKHIYYKMDKTSTVTQQEQNFSFYCSAYIYNKPDKGDYFDLSI